MTWGIFKKDSVSEAYAKMKSEELKGKQHKLDVNKNGKVDGDDLAKLRATKEEAEVSTEELVEYESKDGVYKHQAKAGRYGGSEKESEYVKGPSNKDLEKIEKEKKKPVKEDLDVFSEKDLDVLISEVLSKDQPAGKWIQDFVKSDDPKFAGDSKKQRIKRALGAYYGAQRNESTDYDAFVVLDEEKQADIVKMGAKEIKHANMKDKQQDAEVMEPHSEGEQDFLDKHSILVTDDPTRDKQDGGASKLGKASEPAGKGPGSYDAKEKLGNQKTGVKEEVYKTSAGEEIDTQPAEKKADDKKKFGSFKASMNKEASDCKSKQ